MSSPAQLPAVGQLEFEAGLLSARDGGARRDSVPVLFKLAFSPQWGVLVGGDALVSGRDDAGNRTRGLGDTSVELKRAFLIDSASAFGLELNAKLPTARDSIGSGKADYMFNTIFSKDLGRMHLDASEQAHEHRLRRRARLERGFAKLVAVRRRGVAARANLVGATPGQRPVLFHRRNTRTFPGHRGCVSATATAIYRIVVALSAQRVVKIRERF